MAHRRRNCCPAADPESNRTARRRVDDGHRAGDPAEPRLHRPDGVGPHSHDRDLVDPPTSLSATARSAGATTPTSGDLRTAHPSSLNQRGRFIAVRALRAKHAKAKHDYRLKGLLRCATCDGPSKGTGSTRSRATAAGTGTAAQRSWRAPPKNTICVKIGSWQAAPAAPQAHRRRTGGGHHRRDCQRRPPSCASTHSSFATTPELGRWRPAAGTGAHHHLTTNRCPSALDQGMRSEEPG